MHFSKSFFVTLPILSPKPLRMPRILSSMSMSLCWSCLRDQQGAHLLGSRRLNMKRSELPHAQQLGHAAGVPAIGFDGGGGQRLLDVTGVATSENWCVQQEAVLPGQ